MDVNLLSNFIIIFSKLDFTYIFIQQCQSVFVSEHQRCSFSVFFLPKSDLSEDVLIELRYQNRNLAKSFYSYCKDSNGATQYFNRTLWSEECSKKGWERYCHSLHYRWRTYQISGLAKFNCGEKKKKPVLVWMVHIP